MEENLDPSPECEIGSAYCGLAIRTSPKDELFSVIDKNSISPLASSASAQDFSSLDLERAKIDEHSPRGVLGDCISSFESEIGSSNASTSDSEPQPQHRWRGFARLLKSRSMRRLPSIGPMRVPKLTRRHSRSARGNPVTTSTPAEDNDFCLLTTWKNFSLSELQTATNNFSPENLIGKGGYAEVYKGCLQDGALVAVKRLNRATTEETVANFLAELGIIAHVNHPNTAKLMGYGVEGGMYIVLKFSHLGSLASILHGGSKGILDWNVRYKVALGTAEGLLYLHESCQRRIIHRDIKTSNILLTDDFEPQICDFGLAKWLPKEWTHLTVSKFEGTVGYLAPEYFMHGVVDEKIDVFAFGVLLLELVTGRRALSSSQQNLLMWAKPLLDKKDSKELVDPSLGDQYDPHELNRVLLTASLCIQHSSILRPRMNQVVQLLRNDATSLECIKQFQKPVLKRTYSEELLDAEEYNSTKYLRDLNRHRQIALET
ncbi:receptor-like cytosolic serine/threonine-protein kinase RBK2 [Papaver somniferum]|uniref:receptor-like cytosolic serine/threonine-protein kinase RBK2 n=1 Tax=Papaver somniferum TaxID=3469 RepID=UPI000E6F625B|nr:receptor-like cytosolic serine/threonine-protein kinase RBK2 [Papaver somniferum]